MLTFSVSERLVVGSEEEHNFLCMITTQNNKMLN